MHPVCAPLLPLIMTKELLRNNYERTRSRSANGAYRCRQRHKTHHCLRSPHHKIIGSPSQAMSIILCRGPRFTNDVHFGQKLPKIIHK